MDNITLYKDLKKFKNINLLDYLVNLFLRSKTGGDDTVWRFMVGVMQVCNEWFSFQLYLYIMNSFIRIVKLMIFK